MAKVSAGSGRRKADKPFGVQLLVICALLATSQSGTSASPGETVGAQRVGPPNQVNVDLFGAVVIPCGLVNVSARPNETVRWRLQRVGGAGFLPSDGLFFYKRMRVLNNGSLYLTNAQLCDTQNISCHLVGNAGSVNAYSAALVVQDNNNTSRSCQSGENLCTVGPMAPIVTCTVCQSTEHLLIVIYALSGVSFILFAIVVSLICVKVKHLTRKSFTHLNLFGARVPVSSGNNEMIVTLANGQEVNIPHSQVAKFSLSEPAIVTKSVRWSISRRLMRSTIMPQLSCITTVPRGDDDDLWEPDHEPDSRQNPSVSKSNTGKLEVVIKKSQSSRDDAEDVLAHSASERAEDFYEDVQLREQVKICEMCFNDYTTLRNIEDGVARCMHNVQDSTSLYALIKRARPPASPAAISSKNTADDNHDELFFSTGTTIRTGSTGSSPIMPTMSQIRVSDSRVRCHSVAPAASTGECLHSKSMCNITMDPNPDAWYELLEREKASSNTSVSITAGMALWSDSTTDLPDVPEEGKKAVLPVPAIGRGDSVSFDIPVAEEGLETAKRHGSKRRLFKRLFSMKGSRSMFDVGKVTSRAVQEATAMSHSMDNLDDSCDTSPVSTPLSMNSHLSPGANMVSTRRFSRDSEPFVDAKGLMFSATAGLPPSNPEFLDYREARQPVGTNGVRSEEAIKTAASDRNIRKTSSISTLQFIAPDLLPPSTGASNAAAAGVDVPLLSGEQKDIAMSVSPTETTCLTTSTDMAEAEEYVDVAPTPLEVLRRGSTPKTSLQPFTRGMLAACNLPAFTSTATVGKLAPSSAAGDINFSSDSHILFMNGDEDEEEGVYSYCRVDRSSRLRGDPAEPPMRASADGTLSKAASLAAMEAHDGYTDFDSVVEKEKQPRTISHMSLDDMLASPTRTASQVTELEVEATDHMAPGTSLTDLFGVPPAVPKISSQASEQTSAPTAVPAVTGPEVTDSELLPGSNMIMKYVSRISVESQQISANNSQTDVRPLDSGQQTPLLKSGSDPLTPKASTHSYIYTKFEDVGKFSESPYVAVSQLRQVQQLFTDELCSLPAPVSKCTGDDIPGSVSDGTVSRKQRSNLRTMSR